MGSTPPHLNDDLALEGMMDGIIEDWSIMPTITNPAIAAPEEAGTPDPFRLTNAVHMELQENAKLPTFHLTVDRTGSVSTKPSTYSTHAPADAAAHPDSNTTTMSLMESFLNDETTNRAARHANYAHIGVLKQDTTKRVYQDAPTVLAKDDATPLSPFRGNMGEVWLAGELLDPTPLSEIEMRSSQAQFSSFESPPQQQFLPRSCPLPIPTPPAPNPAAAALADALSTAAAIASRQATADTPDEGSETAPSATTSQALKNPNSLKPKPKHAAAHSVSRPALQEASKQQSQYGFGRKHMVPSVPGAAPRPPPAMSKPEAKESVTTKAPAAQDPVVSSASRKTTERVMDGDAYERKKLRAKNARVKLNESIDRLSIAINLAGTQSKERAAQFRQWEKSNNPGVTTTIRIARDCVSIAGDAKKWDRPSFVGSAASMIQSLNAQCEVLMRELQTLRQQQQQQSRSNASVNKHDADLATEGHPSSNKRRRLNPVQNLPRFVGSVTNSEVSLIDDSESSATETTADTLVFSERTVMTRVASFLEPLSIVRCMRVSKSWKNWGIFSNDPLWQNLATQRFGFFKVRQWKDRLDDDEMGLSAPYALLYRKMDANNEVPHFRHEGMFLLGEARLPGKVSAWTFLVERSNGETMRSVKRRPIDGADSSAKIGGYTSIPVVQLWTVIQNTGIHDEAVVIREQSQTVDASTRRRGEEMKEIDWDERFHKRVLHLDGTLHCASIGASLGLRTSAYGELCRLRLFETVIIETNIHARGCSTTSKFVQKSNFTKVLVQIRDGTTVPLVIPFPRDASHLVI